MNKGVSEIGLGYFVYEHGRATLSGGNVYTNMDSLEECGQYCEVNIGSRYFTYNDADTRCACGARDGPDWDDLAPGGEV